LVFERRKNLDFFLRSGDLDGLKVFFDGLGIAMGLENTLLDLWKMREN
jgi:hypothetical protein